VNEESKANRRRDSTAFSTDVGAKASRKLKARRHPRPGIWAGLGVMGLIGWSVVIPTLLGALVGRWLDKQMPVAHSWTLVLLIAGLCIGCFNAWQWMAKEDQEMREERDNHDV
jgi:ATP synthase protein I